MQCNALQAGASRTTGTSARDCSRSWRSLCPVSRVHRHQLQRIALQRPQTTTSICLWPSMAYSRQMAGKLLLRGRQGTSLCLRISMAGGWQEASKPAPPRHQRISRCLQPVASRSLGTGIAPGHWASAPPPLKDQRSAVLSTLCCRGRPWQS